jgi:hypothetical protein
VIEAYAKNSRTGTTATLSALREDPTLLLGPDKKEPARFRLLARTELGLDRRSGKGPGFVQAVIASIESFYGDILQDLSAYVPKAPKLSPRADPPQPQEPFDFESVPLVDETSATGSPIPMPQTMNWNDDP